MRLPVLEKGQSVVQRMLMGIARTLFQDIPGPILVMSYKKGFFGKHFAKLLQHCMRGMQHWSVAEMELFAAFISKQNDCRY